MRSSPFLAVFKWTVLTVISTGVISTGAILWVSFDGLAHQNGSDGEPSRPTSRPSSYADDNEKLTHPFFKEQN